MRSVRMLSEGALMCALTLLLVLANRVSALLLESAFPWLYAFPLLVYAARYGLRPACLSALSALLCACMLVSWTSLCYLAGALALGVAYGALVHRQTDNALLLALTLSITVIVNLLTMLVCASLFGYDVNEELTMLSDLLQGFLWGVDARALVLSVTLLLSFLQTVCVHALAQLLLAKLHIPVVRMKNLLEIRAPRWLGVGILLIWLLYFAQSVIELQVDIRSLLQALALCALIAAIVYGALTAFAALAFTRVRRWMLLLVYALLFVPVLNLSFALLGEADLLFGLRKAMRRGEKHGTFGKS